MRRCFVVSTAGRMDMMIARKPTAIGELNSTLELERFAMGLRVPALDRIEAAERSLDGAQRKLAIDPLDLGELCADRGGVALRELTTDRPQLGPQLHGPGRTWLGGCELGPWQDELEEPAFQVGLGASGVSAVRDLTGEVAPW